MTALKETLAWILLLPFVLFVIALAIPIGVAILIGEIFRWAWINSVGKPT